LETQRQKKVSTLLLKDLSIIVQNFFREKRRVNLLVSVTKVKISVDLSLAKIYISVFPSENIKKALQLLQNNKYDIKKKLSLLVKNQLRIIPEIQFFVDDSLDYIEGIETAISKGENPLKQ
jgi:ribosome-binding factor A